MPYRTHRTLGMLVVCSLVLVAWCCTRMSAAQAPASLTPSRVLVVYNANWSDGDGDGVGDSLQVADYYASKRGVPAANMLGLNITLNNGPIRYDTTEYARFYSEMIQPIRNRLAALGPANIDVILLCYGVPYNLGSDTSGTGFVAIDNVLMALNNWSPTVNDVKRLNNPYFATNPTFESDRPRFTHDSYKIAGQDMYMVARLDGLSAVRAMNLVDQALYAERYMSPGSGLFNGTVYVDSRYGPYTDAYLNASTAVGSGSYSSYQNADENIAYLERYFAGTGLPLKWENTSGSLSIGQPGTQYQDGTSALTAPRALMYGGWYNAAQYFDVFEWLPGSVGCDLNSVSMISVREGFGWGAAALARGATAVCGVLGEPFLSGHPRPNVLLYYMLKGYSFAEASTLASRRVGWMAMNIGDPLYTPFKPKAVVTDSRPPALAPGYPRVTSGGGASSRTIEVRLDDSVEPETARILVDYGLDTGYGATSDPGAGFYRIAQIGLSNLQPGAIYHYRIRMIDPVGNTSSSGDFTFSTGAQTGSPPAGRTNVALAANGGTATASSTYSSAYAAAVTINGDRTGASWGNGGGWNDGTPSAWPDWLEISFSGSQTIDEVDVFSVQDNYAAPVAPTPAMTFSAYGLRDFEVQYWTGSAWAPVPGGTITNNSLVWRQVTFAPVATTKIRIWVTNAFNTWTRVTEVEAYTSSGPANPAPTVFLTGPGWGGTYSAPASINFTATASDDGSVANVAFYQNGALVGTDTTSPYSFTWPNVAAGTYVLTAVATDNLGATTTSAPVTVTVLSQAGRTNVALAANGGTATASSTFSSDYGAAGTINGDRSGAPWGNGGGWNDGTPSAWPDWLEIAFSGSKTIDEVDVFSVQDNYVAPVNPTASMTFSANGLRDFEVQYWTGSAWAPVPGGTITNNSLVWRQVTFAPVATTKIRIWVTNAFNTWTRVTEVEAYTSSGPANAAPTVSLIGPAHGAAYSAPASINFTATASDDGSAANVAFYQNGALVGTDTTSPYSFTWPNVVAGTYVLTAVATDNLGATTTSAPVTVTVSPPAGRINVALAANGGTATGSSTYSSDYDAAGAINGDRSGAPWGNGGGWNDGTPSAWPDWLEIAFSGSQTIDEVDVFSVQDNYAAPVDPTAGMTFSAYGLRDFEVQYWTGSAWAPVPGGTITNNSLVWRQVTFAPLSTTKIRIWVTNAFNTWTRITEVEAYTSSAPANPAPTVSGTGPAHTNEPGRAGVDPSFTAIQTKDVLTLDMTGVVMPSHGGTVEVSTSPPTRLLIMFNVEDRRSYSADSTRRATGAETNGSRRPSRFQQSRGAPFSLTPGDTLVAASAVTAAGITSAGITT